MEKQEKEQLISFINEHKESIGKCGEPCFGYIRAKKMIRYIEGIGESQVTDEQVVEPQKVKVPECIEKYLIFCMSNETSLSDALTKEKMYTTGPFKFVDEALEWLGSSMNQDIFADAWLHGYEVEEEPKWIVKVNNMYFLNWGEDGTCPTFMINDAPRTKEQAEKYESKQEAELVAEIFGGVVEKV